MASSQMSYEVRVFLAEREAPVFAARNGISVSQARRLLLDAIPSSSTPSRSREPLTPERIEYLRELEAVTRANRSRQRLRRFFATLFPLTIKPEPLTQEQRAYIRQLAAQRKQERQKGRAHARPHRP